MYIIFYRWWIQHVVRTFSTLYIVWIHSHLLRLSWLNLLLRWILNSIIHKNSILLLHFRSLHRRLFTDFSITWLIWSINYWEFRIITIVFCICTGIFELKQRCFGGRSSNYLKVILGAYRVHQMAARCRLVNIFVWLWSLSFFGTTCWHRAIHFCISLLSLTTTGHLIVVRLIVDELACAAIVAAKLRVLGRVNVYWKKLVRRLLILH